MATRRKTRPLKKGGKRNRKCISLETKLKVLKYFDDGKSATEIAAILELPPSTVRTIRINAEKIKNGARNAITLNATKITRSRSSVMENMESLLTIWMEDQHRKNIPITRGDIKEKAKSLHTFLVDRDNGNGPTPEQFKASRGWFERFRRRSCPLGTAMGLAVKSTAMDTEATISFPDHFKTLLDEGQYTAKQVFNVDETVLYWKRLPDRTFIATDEKVTPGFKAGKDKLTLMLGANAEGDFKLKPLVVYHSQTPRALKGYSKEELGVAWRANKKGLVTEELFKEWMGTYVVPALKDYCAKEYLPFKILFLVDESLSHSQLLTGFNDNVKFAFLPKCNDATAIRPMDQGVIAAFKGHYLRRIFRQLLTVDCSDKQAMKDIWRNYDILMAVDDVADAWAEVSLYCLNSAWRKIWPECLHSDLAYDEVTTEREQIAKMASEACFKGMEESDIDELVTSHREELSNNDLVQMYMKRTSETEEDSTPVTSSARLFSVHRLEEFFSLIDKAIDIINEDDDNRARSLRVARGIFNQISCYKKIYHGMAQRDAPLAKRPKTSDDSEGPSGYNTRGKKLKIDPGPGLLVPQDGNSVTEPEEDTGP